MLKGWADLNIAKPSWCFEVIEKKPDFFLVVLKDSVEIFRTPVAININFDEDGNFNFTDGEWVDMGTYLIEN